MQRSHQRDYRTNYLKEKRAEHIAKGLCVCCHRPHALGKKLCDFHLQATTAHRHDKAVNRICTQCVNQAMPKKTLCASCGEKNKQRTRELYLKRKAAGECIACSSPVDKGHAYCPDCKVKHKERIAGIRADRLQCGLCVLCGKVAKLTYHTHCLFCFFAQASQTMFHNRAEATSLQNLFYHQGCCCFYSGLPITPGLNAHMDHTIALAQGGENSIDNLHWVHGMVNQMKWKYPETDFLLMIRAIFHHSCHD